MYARRINMLRSPTIQELFDLLLQLVDTALFVSICAMRRAFNAVMQVISSLIGVLMVLMGGIWIVQGLNLVWGSLSRSFMQGDGCSGVLRRNHADWWSVSGRGATPDANRPSCSLRVRKFSRTTGRQREGSADGFQGLTDPARPLSY
jgi:hypothetical protein